MIVLPFANANGMVVGVLIDNRCYGIRFVKCRDSRIEYVMNSLVSIGLRSATR